MNIIFKRFLAFSLSFAIIFSSVSSANAATSVGGWTALDTITAGATNTINAVKGAGATGMRSAVAVAPSAVKVGKFLIKGGGSAALLLAVPQLIGDGVDWVLDPANNSIKYTDGVTEGGSAAGVSYNVQGSAGASAPDACRAYAVKTNAAWGYQRLAFVSVGNFTSTTVNGKQGFDFFCKFNVDGVFENIQGQQIGVSPDTSTPKEKSIPIDVVAAKVIANAEAGHAPSQEAVKAVALEGFAAGEYDAALDASAVPDSNVDTENPPTDTPTDPVKPFDPSSIIEAIASLRAILAGILSSITSLADFFKAEPPVVDEDTVIEIPDNTVLPADTDINFGGSCPANFEVNSSIFGNPINIVLLDTAKFCGFLSTFVKYPVYAVSSLFALYILGGRKDV